MFFVHENLYSLGQILVFAYIIWLSIFNHLHNSQWITFLTQSCLVLYSLCVRLLHSLIMRLAVSSLSPYNLPSVYGVKCLGEIYEQKYGLKVFARTHMIRKIVRICDVDGFLQKTIWILIISKNFLNFWFDAVDY